MDSQIVYIRKIGNIKSLTSTSNVFCGETCLVCTAAGRGGGLGSSFLAQGNFFCREETVRYQLNLQKV